MSNIKHGPGPSQQKEGANIESAYILKICGNDDSSMIKDENFADAREVLGLNNVELQSCCAGYELPMTHSIEVVEMIETFLSAA